MANDGEPAYPIQTCPNGETAYGLSKVEWFAGMAMQGLLAEAAHPDHCGWNAEQSKLAKESYDVAEAMLAEAEGRNDGK